MVLAMRLSHMEVVLRYVDKRQESRRDPCPDAASGWGARRVRPQRNQREIHGSLRVRTSLPFPFVLFFFSPFYIHGGGKWHNTPYQKKNISEIESLMISCFVLSYVLVRRAESWQSKAIFAWSMLKIFCDGG